MPSKAGPSPALAVPRPPLVLTLGLGVFDRKPWGQRHGRTWVTAEDAEGCTLHCVQPTPLLEVGGASLTPADTGPTEAA